MFTCVLTRCATSVVCIINILGLSAKFTENVDSVRLRGTIW